MASIRLSCTGQPAVAVQIRNDWAEPIAPHESGNGTSLPQDFDLTADLLRKMPGWATGMPRTLAARRSSGS